MMNEKLNFIFEDKIPLGVYFNNNYEKQSRHIDTYFVDNPEIYSDVNKLIEIVKRNEYKLVEDMLEQIDEISNFLSLEDKDDIWELIDTQYPELEFFNLINDVDKYIEMVYLKTIDSSRNQIK